MHTKWAKLQGSVSSPHSRAVNAAREPVVQQALSPWLMLRKAFLQASIDHFLPISITSLKAQLSVCAWGGTDAFWKVRRLSELLKLDAVNGTQAGPRWSWGPSVQKCLSSNIDLFIFWLNVPGEVLQPQGRPNPGKQCWVSIIECHRCFLLNCNSISSSVFIQNIAVKRIQVQGWRVSCFLFFQSINYSMRRLLPLFLLKLYHQRLTLSMPEKKSTREHDCSLLEEHWITWVILHLWLPGLL